MRYEPHDLFQPFPLFESKRDLPFGLGKPDPVFPDLHLSKVQIFFERFQRIRAGDHDIGELQRQK